MPNESDKSFVTDAKALEYLASFPNSPRVDLKRMYPGATEDAIDFLSKTLQFNPYYRISLDECFAHPFFTKVRKAEKESKQGDPIVLEFEKLDLDRDMLRRLFLKEINFYKTQK